MPLLSCSDRLKEHRAWRPACIRSTTGSREGAAPGFDGQPGNAEVRRGLLCKEPAANLARFCSRQCRLELLDLRRRQAYSLHLLQGLEAGIAGKLSGHCSTAKDHRVVLTILGQYVARACRVSRLGSHNLHIDAARMGDARHGLGRRSYWVVELRGRMCRPAWPTHARSAGKPQSRDHSLGA